MPVVVLHNNAPPSKRMGVLQPGSESWGGQRSLYESALLGVAVQAEATTSIVDPEQIRIAGAVNVMTGRAFHLVQ